MKVSTRRVLLANLRVEYAKYLVRIYKEFGYREADRAQDELKELRTHPAKDRPFAELSFMKNRYRELTTKKEVSA